MHWTGKLTVQTFTEAICAIHLSPYVGSPYKDRGGLMLVGPPGVLKTTLLDVLDDNYHNALSISNSFMGTMRKLQASFYNGQIKSLCFPDMQSVYAGDPRTSGRIEQMMMQLAGEASRTVGGDQDARYSKFKGYCTIFGCMTETFYASHCNRWESSGFLRRFLWSVYTLDDPDILIRAIIEWTKADLGRTAIPDTPINGLIIEELSNSDRKEIASWLRHQPLPHEIQLQVLCKATAALRWHYQQIGSKKDAMETMHEFAETLQRDAALLVIPEQRYDRRDNAADRKGNKNHNSGTSRVPRSTKNISKSENRRT